MDLLLEDLLRFMERGGDILWLIFLVAFLMFALLLERFWYQYRLAPKRCEALLQDWYTRSEHRSWCAKQIRTALMSQLRSELQGIVPIIKVLVAMLPMLGLLGTVSGMIHVFDIMGVTGTGNARAMAHGVSLATVPTMAGMVVAVVGIFLVSRLEHTNTLMLSQFDDKLAQEK